MKVQANTVASAVLIATGIAWLTHPARADAMTACGVERWAAKTLQDRPVLTPARRTTLRYLVTRPAPSAIPQTRLPFERRGFTVVASVTLVRARSTAISTSSFVTGRRT
jgi:hypothetical protein